MQLAACLERASRAVSAVGINMLWRSSASHFAQATQMELCAGNERASLHVLPEESSQPGRGCPAVLLDLHCAKEVDGCP
jgi:hypothetical protein